MPGFLQILPQVCLSFADFALYLFIVIHLICRYDWTLGPYSGSPHWGELRGPPAEAAAAAMAGVRRQDLRETAHSTHHIPGL